MKDSGMKSLFDLYRPSPLSNIYQYLPLAIKEVILYADDRDQSSIQSEVLEHFSRLVTYKAIDRVETVYPSEKFAWSRAAIKPWMLFALARQMNPSGYNLPDNHYRHMKAKNASLFGICGDLLAELNPIVNDLVFVEDLIFIYDSARTLGVESPVISLVSELFPESTEVHFRSDLAGRNLPSLLKIRNWEGGDIQSESYAKARLSIDTFDAFAEKLRSLVDPNPVSIDEMFEIIGSRLSRDSKEFGFLFGYVERMIESGAAPIKDQLDNWWASASAKTVGEMLSNTSDGSDGNPPPMDSDSILCGVDVAEFDLGVRDVRSLDSYLNILGKHHEEMPYSSPLTSSNDRQRVLEHLKHKHFGGTFLLLQLDRC